MGVKADQGIVIIGGGIGGTAFALFLQKQGVTSTVYEARSPDELSRRGGGLGIAPNGMRILSELGLSAAVRARGSIYRGFVFFNQRGRLLANYEDQDAKCYPEGGISLARQSLHEVLLEALEAEGIPIYYGKRLCSIDDPFGHPRCTFTDGDSVSTSMVIGADGLSSQTRKILFPNVTPSYTGLIGMGGFIPEAQLSTEGELPSTTRMKMIVGKAGFFGLARSGERHGQGSLMWWSAIPSAETEREAVLGSSDEAKRQMLLKVHQGWCPPVEKVIRSTSNIIADNLYDLPDLKQWHYGNVCLIGDAAHAISPHSGQGVSMALEDAWQLTTSLRHHRGQPDLAFSEFQHARYRRVANVIHYGRQSGNFKKELGPLGVWARDSFVSYVLPYLAQRVAKWMYRSPIDATLRESDQRSRVFP